MQENVNNGIACFKIAKIVRKTTFPFYTETSGGQNSNLYLNVVQIFNTSVN
jgi:hypothetical protein